MSDVEETFEDFEVFGGTRATGPPAKDSVPATSEKKVSFGKRKAGKSVSFGGNTKPDTFTASSSSSHAFDDVLTKVNFVTFMAMVEKGSDCPVEFVEDRYQEQARRYLETRKKDEAESEPKGNVSFEPSQKLRPSPEKTQYNEQKKGLGMGFWFVLIFGAFLAVIAMYVFGASYLLDAIRFFRSDTSAAPPYKVLSLYTEFPTADRRCLPITGEMYQRMKASEDHEWDQMTYSLQKHMENGYLAFSAFRIGKPYCYMMVRTAGNESLLLVNPEIVAVNLDSNVMREERSANCLGRSKHVNRYLDVWVRYQDPNNQFQVVERKFSDRKGTSDSNSFIFQSEYNYLNGRSICDNTEKGADSLLEILREGRTVIRPSVSNKTP